MDSALGGMELAGRSSPMDELADFLDQLKTKKLAEGNFLGFLNVLIGRRISLGESIISNGLGWRDLAGWLKKVRWDPEMVRELGIDPLELIPRDRQRYWFAAISRAGVDSLKGAEAGTRFAAALTSAGYQVGPAPKPGLT
ncbi:MAG: hypothetical protein HY040_25290 [Planctomycetes bacterium]|nr:hypothetical protein [Planctomycetota bacterium]